MPPGIQEKLGFRQALVLSFVTFKDGDPNLHFLTFRPY